MLRKNSLHPFGRFYWLQGNANEHTTTLNMNSGTGPGQKAEIIWWRPFSEISRKTEIKNLKNRERKKSKLFFANLSFRNHKSKNKKLWFLRAYVCVKDEKQCIFPDV